ncbi:MAG: hypothetical protein ACKV2U_08915 [Bryobacteraceae bacterium]
MIPPDVIRSDLAQRTLTAHVLADRNRCPSAPGVVEILRRGRGVRLTVTRETLAKQPRGWLGTWAAQLEDQNCVAPGEGMKLADRIAESIPLDPSVAFNLLYLDDKQTGIVDLGSQTRLKVVSPFLRSPELGLMADGPYSITAGSGYNLKITGKSTENVLGYETAIYAFQPVIGRAGHWIVPLYADRHIQGKTERTGQPVVNQFRFLTDARFYRIFYKSSQTSFTAYLIAARTPAEMEQYTRTLNASSNCEKLGSEICIAIPRNVAVHPMVSVSVNGAEVLIPRGGTVFQAIRLAGVVKPDTVLSQLSVFKLWNGRLVRVQFNPADDMILRLVLRGGETVSWR